MPDVAALSLALFGFSFHSSTVEVRANKVAAVYIYAALEAVYIGRHQASTGRSDPSVDVLRLTIPRSLYSASVSFLL